MRVDCKWHDDIEQYVIVTTGNPTALVFLVDYNLGDDICDDDIHVSNMEHTSVFKVRKSTWMSLSNEMQNYIKTFSRGFVAGFDYGLHD
jgi:hypothetical protein